MTPPLARDILWELADAQHGFVTAKQARDSGVSTPAVQMLVRRGTLTKAAHGVYRFPRYPTSEHDSLALAVLWTGVPEAALSHESVLEAHELGDALPHQVHVTVAKRRRIRRQGGGIAIHYQDLNAEQIGWWQGIPAVTVPTAIGQCITSGLPTYLLRQALVQGFERGLISAVERDKLTRLLEDRSK